MKTYYKQSIKKGIPYMQQTGMVISCGGTAVIEGRIKGRIEVRERRGRRRKQILGDLKETRGYWILKKRKHKVAICGKLVLEDIIDLS
jgi:hypothetical protein